jgi:hypothetical protein
VTTTPAGLARKFRTVAHDLEAGDRAASIEAARVVQHEVLSAARTRGANPRQSWVRIPKTTTTNAIVMLYGGFAYLAEKGSYKAPLGWDIRPRKATAGKIKRARASAVKRGSDARNYNRAALAGHGFGPVATVHHPPVKAKRFWHAGVETARPLTTQVWRRSVRRSLGRQFLG